MFGANDFNESWAAHAVQLPGRICYSRLNKFCPGYSMEGAWGVAWYFAGDSGAPWVEV